MWGRYESEDHTHLLGGLVAIPQESPAAIVPLGVAEEGMWYVAEEGVWWRNQLVIALA